MNRFVRQLPLRIIIIQFARRLNSTSRTRASEAISRGTRIAGNNAHIAPILFMLMLAVASL